MSPVNNLPCDIWFSIVETLDLLDLSRLHEVFNGICLDVDVPSIATRQATKELYRLFISGDNSMEMFIEMEPEDAANVERSLECELKAGLGYKTFFHPGRDTAATKSFFPIPSSNITRLSISATNLLQGGGFYDPHIRGAQHSEIWRTILSLSSPAENPSPHSSQSHRDSVELLYDADERRPSIGIDIRSHGADYKPPGKRSLRQKLRLSSASWRPKGNRCETCPLPRHWFNFLGDSVHASALLEEHPAKFRATFRRSGEPVFLLARYVIPAASISFHELSLPSARSLRRLFPPEVLNTETEDCSDRVVTETD